MLFVDLEIINTGKSPGHLKEIRIIDLKVADAKQPIQWKPDPTPLDERDTLWTIFPGQSSTTQKYDQLTEFESAEIFDVTQGTKRLTIYGFILYDDIFGNRRVTRFYRVFMETNFNTGEGRFMIPPMPNLGKTRLLKMHI